MAKIKRTEIRKRGFFGKLFHILFIGFNVVMIGLIALFWLAAASVETESADAGGAALAGTLGTGVLLSIWLPTAALLGVLSYVTRGNAEYIEETIE